MDIKVKVRTVSESEKEYPLYLEKISTFYECLNSDKLRNNYHPDHLELEACIGLSVYENEGEILGFSTVLQRDLFKGGARILNRFVKKPGFRFTTQFKITPETNLMIDQQVELCRQHQCDYVFISRYTRGSEPALSHFLQDLVKVRGWHSEKSRYRVCCGRKDCWQHLIWLPLSGNLSLPLRSISESEFQKI